MKARRHTPEQVIRKLREADRMLAEGKSVGEVCRHLEVSELRPTKSTVEPATLPLKGVINPAEDLFYELLTELSELVDLSDRKFVAVAIAHGKATILAATDSKW